MKLALKIIGFLLALIVLIALAAGGWYVYKKQPQRSGVVRLTNLQDTVTVDYDDRGVPHIRAENEEDLYRALGYVHAQDRLFQMEMLRRLARGELSEILGTKLVKVDTLFRTLGLRAKAEDAAARLDPNTPSVKALLAYLDGINQYQDTHKAPMEFDLLKIPKRPFTPEDTMAVNGYVAYSFAKALKNEPVMTYVRDKLGPRYLKAFDIDWHPEGVITPLASKAPAGGNLLANGKHMGTSAKANAEAATIDWDALGQLAQVSQQASELAGIAPFEGSNAWVVSGRRTASGKPLLAGDPHIAYSVPSVWYEAHLSAPKFELYGHFQALTPVALLGHNRQFGWTLTMFQNDDMDLIAEKVNPENPNQVWFQDQWVDMISRTETIVVRDAPPVHIKLRQSPHGPVVTDAFKENFGRSVVSMWWAFLETENPALDAFYELNRANTRDLARAAVSKIHAPGLNVLWANAKGDIAWWAAAKLPQRPEGVNPTFILDAGKGEAEKNGFFAFDFNPQEENPARGYIVSANHQPQPPSGVPVPGYYNAPDRARRLDEVLRMPDRKWDVAASKELQLDTSNGYSARLLKEILPPLETVITDANEKAFMEPLKKWDGSYTRDSIAATLFTQLKYELTKAVFADELGDVQFKNLLESRLLDNALVTVAADADSAWWDNIDTAQKESRFETLRVAWSNTLKHLMELYGTSLLEWSWGKSHTLTHVHPLGRQQPLDKLFNVGPFPVSGGHETPNNMAHPLGPAPWAVSYGPSTRRIIDFADPSRSLGINPVGQSGILFDKHYSDQAELFAEGLYQRQRLDAADIKAHTESTLTLRPGQ